MLNTGTLNLEHFSNSQGNSGSDTLPPNSTFIDDVNDNADNNNNAFINLSHINCCSLHQRRGTRKYRDMGNA